VTPNVKVRRLRIVSLSLVLLGLIAFLPAMVVIGFISLWVLLPILVIGVLFSFGALCPRCGSLLMYRPAFMGYVFWPIIAHKCWNCGLNLDEQYPPIDQQ